MLNQGVLNQFVTKKKIYHHQRMRSLLFLMRTTLFWRWMVVMWLTLKIVVVRVTLDHLLWKHCQPNLKRILGHMRDQLGAAKFLRDQRLSADEFLLQVQRGIIFYEVQEDPLQVCSIFPQSGLATSQWSNEKTLDRCLHFLNTRIRVIFVKQ